MRKINNPTPNCVDAQTFKKIGTRVAIVGIVVNIVLTIFKLLAGIIAHSGAMVSDAIHSASDILATALVLIGIRMAGRAADKTHPYGHERLECVFSIILAVILALVAIGVGKMGLDNFGLAMKGELPQPGTLALIAAVVSIAVKEGLFHYTIHKARAIGSSSLKADAWHHRSDAFSSIGSLIGVLGARLGLPILDPIASLIICLLILKVAYDVAAEALRDMVDRSCSEETIHDITNVVLAVEGVNRIDLLKTRIFASKIYIDIEIAVDPDLQLRAAHAIAEEVHDNVEKSFLNCKHCMVHVNPDE